jgi:hypothetical protein
MGRRLLIPSHVHKRQRFIYASPYFSSLNSKVLRPKRHVLFDSGRYYLVIRVLEHHAHRLADLPQTRLVLAVHPEHVDVPA